jgi:hypothetical protein
MGGRITFFEYRENANPIIPTFTEEFLGTDLDSEYWSVEFALAGGSYNVSNGVLEIVTSGAFKTEHQILISSEKYMTGDFDLRVNYERTTGHVFGGGALANAQSQVDVQVRVDADNYIYIKDSYNYPTFRLGSVVNVDGSQTETTGVPIPNPRWIRVTRVGNQWRSYYSTTNGSWTEFGTPANQLIGSGNAQIRLFQRAYNFVGGPTLTSEYYTIIIEGQFS